MNAREIRVWDPLVRGFHWLLVAAYFIAYFTEDDWLQLHVWAGYLILALLLVRLIWGLIGSRHARFSDFVFRPSQVVAYLKDLLALRARRYIGHNPAGGAMVILMLFTLILISISGLMLYGLEEHAGPMAGLLAGVPDSYEDIVEEVHELLVNFSLILVAIHVAGVIVESVLHHENLVRAMINGRKRA